MILYGVCEEVRLTPTFLGLVVGQVVPMTGTQGKSIWKMTALCGDVLCVRYLNAGSQEAFRFV